jgi:hypothetical protein
MGNPCPPDGKFRGARRMPARCLEIRLPLRSGHDNRLGVGVPGLAGVATFIGGVVNSGTIVAGHTGIRVISAGVFSGGIVDSGRRIIAGNQGILVNNAVIFGSIQVSSKGTICGERRRHRRHLDGERWPPRREHCAYRQLHRRELRCCRRRPRRYSGHASATAATARY